jgi:hypothetical protein
MAIREKLEKLAESGIDALRTTEVQIPLLGLLWAAAHALLPATIPARVDLPDAIVGAAAGVGIALPLAITPGWFIICLPIIFFLKSVTPGRVPFSTANTKTVKAEPVQTVVTTVESVTVDTKTTEKEI